MRVMPSRRAHGLCRALGRFGSKLGTVRMTAEMDREAYVAG